MIIRKHKVRVFWFPFIVYRASLSKELKSITGLVSKYSIATFIWSEISRTYKLYNSVHVYTYTNLAFLKFFKTILSLRN